MGLPDDLTRLRGAFGDQTLRAMGRMRDGQLGLGGVGGPRSRIVKAQGVGHAYTVFDMDHVTDCCKGLLDPRRLGALKTTAALEQFEPLAGFWPRVSGYALNVLTDLGDHALRTFEFDWLADCGDSDLCSLVLAEQLQRVGGATVLQRIRGEDFRGAVWVCRDLPAGCPGCAMSRDQRAAAHHIHSCTRPDRGRPARAAAALLATQAAAAAHAVQEQWLLQDSPQARPPNYVARFDARTVSCRTIAIRRDRDCPHHPTPIPWDNVQVLTDAHTRTTRPLDLLNETGADALVLDRGRDLVELIACPACDARFRLEPPVAAMILLANHVGCPKCGGDLRPLVTVPRITRECAAARETLFDLGMPIGHVYRCDGPTGWLAVADEHVELERARTERPQRTWNLQPISHAEATAAWMRVRT